MNLFRFPLLRRIIVSPFYPLTFQVISIITFLLIIFFGFSHTPMGEDNFAVVVTWRLWWLLLPFSLLLFGRLWCGVCPVGAANDAAGKISVPWRMDPPRFLRKYGAWIMGSLFLVFFLVGMIRHTCCWPRETAIILLIFTGGALLMGIIYRGLAWCRYFCPLGIFCGLLSMTGLIALRSKKDICQDICRDNKRQVLNAEMETCPLYELPMALDSNRNCNLCGKCVKYCQYDSMQLSLRLPGKNLTKFKPSTGEAFFILAFLGIVIIEVMQTTQLYPNYMKWAMENSGVESYNIVFSLTLLFTVTIVIGLFLLVSRLSRLSGHKAGRTATLSMAYGYIPLSLAVYLGVALLRLSEYGVRSVQAALNELSPAGDLFELSSPLRGSFFTFEPAVKAIQLIFLTAGVLMSFYFITRLAKGVEPGKPWNLVLPHTSLLLIFSALFWFVFVLPAGVILH